MIKYTFKNYNLIDNQINKKLIIYGKNVQIVIKITIFANFKHK